MIKIKRFEDIDAWKEARKLVNSVYMLIQMPSFSKDFSLRDQIIRAAISTMSNIAEGFDSATDQQFIQFLIYSRRSSSEVQSHLYIALDNGYIKKTDFEETYAQAETARKLCSGFITYLRKSRLPVGRSARQPVNITGGQEDRKTG